MNEQQDENLFEYEHEYTRLGMKFIYRKLKGGKKRKLVKVIVFLPYLLRRMQDAEGVRELY